MSTQPSTAETARLDFLGSSRFQLRRHLGEGSMGAVYLAYDRERGGDVALKTLRRVDAVSIYRFKREFRALSDVVHPNLVALYDLFHEEDLWYFTMEYVEGQDFLSYVLGRRRSVPLAQTPEALEPATLGEDPRPQRGLQLLFPTPLRNEERLREVLMQIAQGLLAIHAAGRLHRDLKSDNVIVTADGRAKVLDFGIAIERVSGNHGTLELGVMGTPAYMSPEQAAGRAVDEATDWYALGVMLYEALTGSVPFDGGYLEVMNQKQRVDATPPSQVVSGVPADLEALCVRLLQRSPGARPPGLSVLRALERRRPPSIRPANASSVPAEPDAPFVGRALELAELKRHLAQTDRAAPVVSFVQGPSGIGKTTLVERFVSELLANGDAVVLKGRCYEREAVPFKAWDSLIDSLSRYLRRLPAVDAAEVLPRDILALAHLFPVLKRVEVVATARRRVPQAAFDRQELRRRAFGALKELLCRLADRTPVVLFIDDLQWGDVDSAQLMGELLRGTDAPAILFVLSYRSGELENSPCLQALLPHTHGEGDVRAHELMLPPLTEGESIDLAGRLLGSGLPAAARGIGLESQGSPHLLTELVRHVTMRKRDGTASHDTARGLVTFERALMRRVAELTGAARTLLELLSVAGRPVAEESLSLTSSFGIDLQPALTELRGGKLIRGVGTHERRAVETYHDRIREAVVAALPAERLEQWHKRLASTLEATGSADLEAIVDHLIGAGDGKRAQIYAIRAATQAADALAFEKAARLFAIAVEHQGDEGWGHELLVRWADALVNAGRNRQAAAVYFDAARAASDGEAEQLRRKAGLQLLASGHEEEALELLSGMLQELGMQVPATREAGAAELALLRARIARRGFGITPRPASALPAAVLDRLDALWWLAAGMACSDQDRALSLAARFLLEALEAGELDRCVRALCLYHGLVDVPLGALERRPLQGALAAAEALDSLGVDAPHAQARIVFAHGLDALRSGDPRAALRALAPAEELFRTRCVGAAPEMRMCRTAMAYLDVVFCRIDRLRSIEAWAEEADEHEDLLAGTRLKLLLSFGRLVHDQPERAERELSHAMARWGRRRFDLTSAAWGLSDGLVALYRGDAAACLLVANRTATFFSSTLAAAPLYRADALLLRARALITASAADADADALLARADEDVRAAAALRLGCFEQRIRLLRASSSQRRGDTDTALAMLEAVLSDRSDQPDAALTLAAARRRKGQLVAGEQGRELVLAADTALREQGVHNPEAFVRLFAPGF